MSAREGLHSVEGKCYYFEQPESWKKLVQPECTENSGIFAFPTRH